MTVAGARWSNPDGDALPEPRHDLEGLELRDIVLHGAEIGLDTKDNKILFSAKSCDSYMPPDD